LGKIALKIPIILVFFYQFSKITVENAEIAVVFINDNDYISLTDIARSQMEEHIIIKWLSLKNTIEYIGEWENLYNPSFNYTEFGTIKSMAGSNNFVLSAKIWQEKTNAVGITAKTGRYGGTYAHKIPPNSHISHISPHMH
jgi:hypothetical protein